MKPWFYLHVVSPGACGLAAVAYTRVLPRRRTWGYVPSGELQASLYRFDRRAAIA